MNKYGNTQLLSFAGSFLVGLALSLGSFQAASEDIDIFSVDLDQTANTPNVLIILDNSANWSRQAQKWEACEDPNLSPGDAGCKIITQGQSEARAIKKVIVDELGDGNVNVGLLEYRTAGSASDSDNGYIRYHIRPMNSDNKQVFGGHMDTIFDNINAPIEKRSSSNPFGNLMWEAYNYLAGVNSIVAGAGTPDIADPFAYDSQHDLFRSPLTSIDSCTRTIIIFIGNNTQSGPTADSQANIDALAALGGDTAQQPFAEFQVITEIQTELRGYTAACYESITACTEAENAFCTGPEGGFDSCECIQDGTHPAEPCTVEKFTVFGQNSERVEPPASTSPPEETFDVETGEGELCLGSGQDPNPLTCPSTATVVRAGPGPNQETETITEWSTCRYEVTDTCGNKDNKNVWTPKGDKTVTENIYDLTITEDTLGLAGSCSADANHCDPSSFTACTDGTYDNCICDTPSDASGCSTTNNNYQVRATFTSSVAEATGETVDPPEGPLMADEWARFLRNKGVPLPGGTTNVLVTTYTIDVFNAQQHEDISGLLFNMADQGEGKYFQARNEDQIEAALRDILTEVQAVNSAFSSASLPVNATNRTQNENQVFIGLFSPNRVKNPLWFGNLKRYQLVQDQSEIKLGDKNGNLAINELTGFITECAESFWTTDSGDYWSTVGTDDPPAESQCGKPGVSIHSDLPDGPFVQKGAAAEVLRKGNNDPAAAEDAQGNFLLSRNIQTLSGTSLVDFTADNSDGFFDPNEPADVRIVNFIRGEDVRDEDGDGAEPADDRALTEPRSTIHGDVIHSRPQPINYGDSTNDVVVFYGANDGTYRAVRSSDGVELWSFVAPEHFSKLERLRTNTPAIRFKGDTLPAEPKDYFFDGSTGVFLTFDANDKANEVRIFPSMRRGGRKVYAFDVTNPANPSYSWSKGCSDPIPDTASCDSGFDEIGQTWSQPAVAFIKGHSETEPVVIFGGGYDPCEDPNTAPHTDANFCNGARGSGVYVVEARSGDLLKHFDFNARSVAADVSLIDVNLDGLVDYAYAADTGGNIYRMDFLNSSGSPVGPADWTWSRIAFTSGAGRKFLFTPALFQATAKIVYLAIGSGDREHPLENDYPVTGPDENNPTPIVNRFYVFKDDVTDVDATTEIDLDDTTVMQDLTDPANATCADLGITPAGTDAGWFMDLRGGVDPPGAAEPGEQTVTSAVIIGGAVFFSTNRATGTSQTACTNSLGEARGYSVNLLNGSGTIGVEGICGGDRSSEFVGGGLPPSPVIATVEIDGVVHTVCIGCADSSASSSGFDSALEANKVELDIASIRRPVYWFKTGDTD